MGVHLHSMALKAKQLLKLQYLVTRSQLSSAPKGHLAVYVGETEKKRFVVPVSYLNHPSFQDLLSSAGEEFGFNPNGWPHNPMQRILILQSYLSFSKLLDAEGDVEIFLYYTHICSMVVFSILYSLWLDEKTNEELLIRQADWNDSKKNLQKKAVIMLKVFMETLMQLLQVVEETSNKREKLGLIMLIYRVVDEDEREGKNSTELIARLKKKSMNNTALEIKVNSLDCAREVGLKFEFER
ncbi:hypothetical protein Sjap_013098 [Stephania japonica]|uniref:Uncharacterized protein n=1 Tax=Stephania japonica TaxID=461633 RepID=A0AAP0IZR2_9MAGN